MEVAGERKKLRLKNQWGELVAAYKFSNEGREELLTVRKTSRGDYTDLRVFPSDVGTKFPLGTFSVRDREKSFDIFHRDVKLGYRRTGLATKIFDLLEDHFFSRGALRSTASTSRKSTLLFLLKRGYDPVANQDVAERVRSNPVESPETLASEIQLAKPAPRQRPGKRFT